MNLNRTLLDRFFPNLFGTLPRAMARNTDPDTSHEAAASVSASELEQIVYDVIAKCENGCTADDIEKALPLVRSNSFTPRFAPLIRKGYIYDTGERRVGSSGRKQRVVKATPNRME